MFKIIESLNPKQQEAVLYNDGSLAIIAGAGAGKTRTITHKIAYLVQEEKISPHRILAVTFTNKAANEMKERVVALIGKAGINVRISTYHALCARILREEITLLGYRQDFNIIDQTDQKQILKMGYQKLGLSFRSTPYLSVIKAISKFKNNGISPYELQGMISKDIDKTYAKLYEFYLHQTQSTNSLDFDDLLIFIDKLFETNQQVVNKWAAKFDYVMVDEFQDTSTIQYNIIKKIVKNSIFTVVGDPDQNIYTWRYADPKLIVNFSKKNKDSKIILLEQNYRSTKTILNAANKLIKNNQERIDKNLFTTNPHGSNIEYYHGFSEDSEARWVINRIQNLIVAGERPNNIAILYRSNFLTNALEKALIKKNINYIIYGAIKFYQRQEIKDIVAYLKLINNGDPLSLKRVINTPSRLIGPVAQAKIYNYTDRFGADTFNIMVDKFQEINISYKSKLKLANFIDLIKKYQIALKTNSIKNVIQNFIIEINYEQKLSSFENQMRTENIQELISNIAIWEKEHQNETLNDFINEISLYTDHENTRTKKGNSISLMTIHTSKGLEFKHVFIFGMTESIFPSWRTLEEASFNGIEEERRLAYVAVTRAMKKLYISSSRGYALDYASQKTPSRFIKELGINPKNHSKYFIFEQEFEQEKTENNFIEGDNVIHEKFGKGIILSVEGTIVKVAFKNPYGIKSMMKDHKTMRKEGE